MSLERTETRDDRDYEPFKPPIIAQVPPASGSTSFFHMLEILNSSGKRGRRGSRDWNQSDLDSLEDDDSEPSTPAAMDLEGEATKMQHSDEVKDNMARDEAEAAASSKAPAEKPATEAHDSSGDYLRAHGAHENELEERLAVLTRQAVVPEGEAQGVWSTSSDPTTPGAQEAVEHRTGQFPGTYIPHDAKTDPATDPKRLEILRNAFGPCDYLGQNEPEHFIGESQGMLVGSVLVKGRLFLTNTRLIFYAMLPALEADRNTSQIIKAGPTTTHLHGIGKTRFYAVLTRDSISLNKSSKDLYTPSGMLGLNDIVKVIEPEDFLEPTLKFVYIDRRPNGQRSLVTTHNELDTAEEAISWRRELASAVFAFQNKRDRYRASLPLDRIASAERSSFFGFSTVATIVIEKEPGEMRTLKLGVPRHEEAFWHKLDQALAHISERIPADKRPVSECAIVDLFSPPNAEGPRQRTASVDSTGAIPSSRSLEDDGDDGDEADLSDKVERRKLRLAAGHQVTPESITSVYHAELPRFVSPVSGVLGFSPKHGLLFFARRAVGNTKIRIPVKDVQGARSSNSLRFSTYSMKILVRGHEDIEFELHSKTKRDHALADALALGKTGSTSTGTSELSKASSTASSIPDQGSPVLDALTSPSPSLTSTLTQEPSGVESESPSEAQPPSPSDEARVDHTKSLASRKNIPGGFGSYAGARKELPFGSFIVGGRAIQPSQDDHLRALDEHMKTATTAPMIVPIAASTLIPRAINFELGDMQVNAINICLMTIGSRGDVQPYIALGRRMMRGSGQHVTIATHPEYKEWVESFGIKHRPIGGDPTLLMQVSVEHKIFSLETIKKFRQWMDDLLDESYAATEGMDLVVESPSTMAGIHVCEARKIPYIRAFTMPWTRTKAFPHAFMSSSSDSNGSFNYSTYILFENVMWRASAGQINRFRHKIGLQSTDLDQMRQRDIPFVYNFSTAVVPRPLDWPEHIQVSGYWFLDTDLSTWTPPEKLTKFIESAKAKGKPIVYIGFGSITVPDPAAVTKAVVEAVEQTGVYCILCKGWSSRLSKETKDDVPLPECILQVASVPHDWLFDRIDAAMHHGGAGTTAASLRAGIPTLIKPFFGDQYFWARTVTANGSGLRVHSLSAKDMADAISQATSSRIMREKAEQIGEKLRTEDGLGRAIKFLSQFYVRAIKRSGAGYDSALQETHDEITDHNPLLDTSLSGETDSVAPLGQPLGAVSPTVKGSGRSISGRTMSMESNGEHHRSSLLPKLGALHLGGSKGS